MHTVVLLQGKCKSINVYKRAIYRRARRGGKLIKKSSLSLATSPLRYTHAMFVFGPSRTSRRVLCFAFLLGGARLCVFLSTPVTRIDGLGGGWGWGWGGGSGGGGWGGRGGLIAFCRLLPVASSFRHAPDVTLYRSSLAILDTLMMLRSIDLLLPRHAP